MGGAKHVNIRNAFAKLLSEKEIDTITIREVSELAEINRKTFYRYYRGIYQVVDEIEDEVVNAFENVLNNVDMNTALEDPYRIFEGLTSIIDTDIVFYGHLLSMQKNASLASKITAVLKEKTKQAMVSVRKQRFSQNNFHHHKSSDNLRNQGSPGAV